MKIYAGIGSRQTPEHVLDLMQNVATWLETKDWLLRSGGAEGADTAFELGVRNPDNMEIYIPWRGFQNRHNGLWKWPSPELEQEASIMASNVHPNWGACNQGARKLHTRNVAQVLGHNLDQPVDMILCWTPGGLGKGGTGLAIRLAKSLHIPVFDFGGDYDEVQQEAHDFIMSKD